MTPQTAQDIATDALVWLCNDPDMLGAFLGQSGADPDDLRRALQSGPDNGVLGSVLDFVLLSDAQVIDCAQAQGVTPDKIGMAAAILSGRARMHWT